MGLARDNRMKQKSGSLLNLTKQDQVKRQEWQAKRAPDWTDKMIVCPSVPDGKMSWGFCRAFDFELGRFTHYDMPGSTNVPHVLGKSTVIRTDTTDKLNRSSRSIKRIKLSLQGD